MPVIAAGLGMSEDLEHGRSDVADAAAAPDLGVAIGVVHVEERHRVERVRRVRRARLRVLHLLAVAVIGGDDERAVLLAHRLGDATDADVDGLDGA